VISQLTADHIIKVLGFLPEAFIISPDVPDDFMPPLQESLP
jgi:hypothetical protein